MPDDTEKVELVAAFTLSTTGALCLSHELAFCLTSWQHVTAVHGLIYVALKSGLYPKAQPARKVECETG